MGATLINTHALVSCLPILRWAMGLNSRTTWSASTDSYNFYFSMSLFINRKIWAITKTKDFEKILHMAISWFLMVSASLEIQKPCVHPASQLSYSKCLRSASSHTQAGVGVWVRQRGLPLLSTVAFHTQAGVGAW